MKSKLIYLSVSVITFVIFFILPTGVFGDDLATEDFIKESSDLVDDSLYTQDTEDESSLSQEIDSEDLKLDLSEIEKSFDDTLFGTEKSGTLENNEIWTKEAGPYYVTDLYIPPSVSVTVEAGVEIYVGGYIAVFGNFFSDGEMNIRNVINLHPEYSDWNIFVGEFAHLNLAYTSVNNVSVITTQNGFLDFRNVEINDSLSGIILGHFGSLFGEHMSMRGSGIGTTILAIDNSTIFLKDSDIESFGNVGNYMLQGYDNSKISIFDTTISTDSNVPIIMVGGELNIERTEISGGSDNALEIYPDTLGGISVSTKVSILNTKIEGFAKDAILTIDPDMMITDSKVVNNGFGIESYARNNFSIKVSNSVISGNGLGVIFGDQGATSVVYDVRGNFWGDPMGPYVPVKNEVGIGDAIVVYNDAVDKILFSEWLLKEPNKKVPVIIIPGVMGSFLNHDDEDKTEVWPNFVKGAFPGTDKYLDDLILNSSGELDTENILLTQGAIINVDILNFHIDFFNGLVTKLTADGYKLGEDLFIFPYDWRLDIDDVVQGADNSKVESFRQKIDQILLDTKSDKVDIVAHSMGGLIAKYYIKNVDASKVNKFVDIGTPHLGAPKASKVLLYGDDAGFSVRGLGFNPEKIKEISQNMPSAYNLLPSKKYFDTTPSDYNYYIYDLEDIDGNNVRGKLSYRDTKTFLENTGRNSLLIQNAENLHNDLDDFSPVDYGVDSYNIVGCGVPTIGKIFVNKKKTKSDYEYQIKYVSGDGTVPQKSALGMSVDHLFYATDIQHATMSSDVGVRNLISAILIEKDDFSLSANIKTDDQDCKLPNGQIISIHSPVDLHIFDELGRHVGPDINGDIEYQIPNVVYDVLEDNKFAFIPEGINYTIKINASGVGTAGVDVQDFKSGNIIKSESFYDIPIESLDMKGEIVFEEEGSKILIDTGDGEVETLLPQQTLQGDLDADSNEENGDSEVSEKTSQSGSRASVVTTSPVANVVDIKIENFSLEDKVTNLAVKENDSLALLDTGSTDIESVELESDTNYHLASPQSFLAKTFDVIWSFVLNLINKIFSFL